MAFGFGSRRCRFAIPGICSCNFQEGPAHQYPDLLKGPQCASEKGASGGNPLPNSGGKRAPQVRVRAVQGHGRLTPHSQPDTSQSRQPAAWHSSAMRNDRHRYRRHRFPPEIISHVVWLYHRLCSSGSGVILSSLVPRRIAGSPIFRRRLLRMSLRSIAAVSAVTLMSPAPRRDPHARTQSSSGRSRGRGCCCYGRARPSAR